MEVQVGCYVVRRTRLTERFWLWLETLQLRRLGGSILLPRRLVLINQTGRVRRVYLSNLTRLCSHGVTLDLRSFATGPSRFTFG
jgi:hypothetical protein